MCELFFKDSSITFAPSSATHSKGAVVLEENANIGVAKMIEKLENNKHLTIECPNPKEAFERFSSNFRVVEAAGGVVSNEEGAVLMIFRNKRWDLPKGHVESGEQFDIAALREVEEETGASGLTNRGLLTTTHHFYELAGEWLLKRTWWYVMSGESGEKLEPQQEEQITKAEWVERQRVKELAEGSFASIERVVEVYFEFLSKNQGGI